MLIKTNLRADAEAEASRLQAARAGAGSSRFPCRGVACTTIRHPESHHLIRPGAIFFTRTRIVDGRGRVVEDLIVAVQVRTAGLQALRAQKMLDSHHAAVRSAALAEVARRLRTLAAACQRGLQRARAREVSITALIENDVLESVQAGLFDHRAVQNHDRSVHRRTTMSNEHRVRTEALDASLSLLVAQPSDTALLLIVAPHGAKPACCRD
jgi:hypothetical protein